MGEHTMANPGFSIRWQIQAEKWAKARVARQENLPGSDYDAGLTPLYDLLYGYVQFTYNENDLFAEPNTPYQGRKVSVLDLAVELIRTVGTEEFAAAPDGTTLQLVELEFRVEIIFIKRADHIVIRVNQPEVRELSVPQEAFFQGLQAFLAGFVGEIRKQEAPLLEWECVSELRRF
jgi:hypothetical protein